MADADTERLGLLLNETARTWRTKLDQRLKPLGLSVGKWSTLAHLARGGDKLTQSEIAARVGIEEPTLVGILDRLEDDGWIQRKSHAGDRRCKTVHLRKRSKSVLAQIFSTAAQLRHELLNDIPRDDLETCVRVLSHIRDKAGAGLPKSDVQSAGQKRNGKKA